LVHLLIKTLAVGPLQTNCYIVGDEETKEGLIVDPAAEPGRILAEVRRLGWRIVYIVDTHGHLDHILANDEVRRATGAPLLIGAADAPYLEHPDPIFLKWLGVSARFAPPDRLLKGGENLPLGTLSFRVLNTPGHTPGGISLHGEGVVFTGDALFNQGVGRTDLPGGNWRQLQESIQTELFALPEDTAVYPGHGPATKIGLEKTGNPFL
jgi:hydroxyacylglutathione hydrolase